jgi:hypothetical protein
MIVFALIVLSIPAQDKQDNPAMETTKGTIDFVKQPGGCFTRGENSSGELFIVSQDPKTLKPRKGSGKSVTIQGYITNQGAGYFLVTKIDGKKYKAPKSAK